MMVGGRRERDHSRSRARHAYTSCAALLALALASAIAPTSAAASSGNAAAENAAATHAYLVAANGYEETELANLLQENAAREAIATRISGECAGVLTNAPPHEEVSGFGLVGPGTGAAQSARAEGERRRQSRQLGDLKLELSLALDDSHTEADREAEVTLIRTLTPLKWSNPELTFLVRTVAAVAKEELEIPAPPVCADMTAWVASAYKMLSPASKEVASRSETLLKRSFELLTLAAQADVQPVPKLLAPYENAADRALVRHTEALDAQLRKGSDPRADVQKRVEAAVGLPATKVTKVERPTSKPVVIARGKTAAGGSFVVQAERLSRSAGRSGCTVDITISEPSRPSVGLLEILSGEGTGRCLSRSHVDPEPAVHCNSGLLAVEANLLPTTRSVRLLLSNGDTITSPAIRVPARLGGPAGLYYQVVRGPAPIPVSLTELDAQGSTLTVLTLPAVVECTRHPVKYFPHGIVSLVHESPPHIPAFTIRAERYRKLGTVHFELKLEVSNEEELSGNGGGGFVEVRIEEGVNARGRRAFEPKSSSGCQPQPYVIIYGLLEAPRDTVLVRVSGSLVPLRTVAIPTRLHAGGALAYGAFSPIPTELLIRDASGKTVSRQDLSEAAKFNIETCEGEAE